MKDAFMIKFRFSLILFCSNISAVFKRGYNAQHSLNTLIEKWKNSVDNGGAFSALFNDFSKAFQCLSHKPLIAKLDACGLDQNAIKLVNSYISNRKQRVKNIVHGVKYYLGFPKVQFYGIYCSIFPWVTFVLFSGRP